MWLIVCAPSTGGTRREHMYCWTHRLLQEPLTKLNLGYVSLRTLQVCNSPPCVSLHAWKTAQNRWLCRYNLDFVFFFSPLLLTCPSNGTNSESLSRCFDFIKPGRRMCILSCKGLVLLRHVPIGVEEL